MWYLSLVMPFYYLGCMLKLITLHLDVRFGVKDRVSWQFYNKQAYLFINCLFIVY